MEKNKVARDQGRQPVERGGKQLMLRRAREKGGLTEHRAAGTRGFPPCLAHSGGYQECLSTKMPLPRGLPLCYKHHSSLSL